ncbi:uncharacterized protein LOC100844984 [Brachypodium distachyon]|uniref:Uncharacterized protein n=1 Tax=Brachypodium distachyon TaxID=15368 RepID=I1HQH6_BRADI|nr:uncharacterized protein LOC100844984 [Brachypodium distachyon]KQK09239.1 hypothetical protein BRADI_2g46850v3 [Brachypodium distachyon]|eukprot:XP_010232158.1 uncharacterized protein LOC100844984 [Brachypodium distachyon]
MSDGASRRFGEKDFEIMLSKSDVRESSYRKHSLWMAHWTRDGNSAEPLNSKSCRPFEEIDDVGYSKDCGNLPFELMKARVAERLMVGVSHGGASSGSTRQLSSNMWGVAHDVSQEVQCKNTDQFDRPFESSMVQKNVNLYAAKTVVSGRFSVHKPSDLSVDSHKLLSSDSLSSEWSHFPMFAINRKIDSILNPRRSALATSSDKIFVPQNTLKANISTSNVMAFSSKEYQFQTHQVSDENMTHCKSAGVILSHLDDDVGLNSDRAVRKLKGPLSIEESCSCSKDETNSACSLLADELRSSHSKGSPFWSGKDKFMFEASRKENEIVEDFFLQQKLGTSGGCQKEQDFEVAFHEPALGREYQMKSVNASSISKGIDVDINGHAGTFADLLQGEQQHPSTQNGDSPANLTESSKLPDTIEKISTMKSKGEALGCRKPPKQKSTHSKQKGSCLFEMLTLPCKSHVTCSKDPTCSGISCSNKGRCSLGTQKQFSAKTDTYTDTYHASKSTAGFASMPIQKDRGCSDSGKTERLVSCEGNETINMCSDYQNSSSKAACASNQDWSIPKTSSMNLDLVLFQISRMRNPISKALTESPASSDPSDKWLKRLKCDISDSHVSCSKRLKIGDGPATEGTCAMFGEVLDYKRDRTSMIKHVKEDQLMHETSMEQENQDLSSISAKSLNDWIGRWCQGGTPSFHGTSSLGKQSRKSTSPPDCLEGQFPSIAAMAMMGRVMNKLRPCELQKRGPSVVWNTEGL